MTVRTKSKSVGIFNPNHVNGLPTFNNDHRMYDHTEVIFVFVVDDISRRECCLFLNCCAIRCLVVVVAGWGPDVYQVGNCSFLFGFSAAVNVGFDIPHCGP